MEERTWGIKKISYCDNEGDIGCVRYTKNGKTISYYVDGDYYEGGTEEEFLKLEEEYGLEREKRIERRINE